MNEIIEKLKSVKLSILTHPDCEPNSEFDDMADTLDEVIGELGSLHFGNNFTETTEHFLSHLQQKDELSIKMGNDENFKHHMQWLKENRKK